MKSRRIPLLMAVLLVLVSFPVMAEPGYALSSGDYTYFALNNNAIITGYSGPGGNIIIPDTLTGYPVTAIADNAFKYCSRLTSVTIPTGVTCIGWSTFANCTNLTSVTIPSGMTSIGDYAFYNCSSLASITLPSSMTNIGNYTFSYCTNLASITLPSSLASIGAKVFEKCTNLTSVTIPSGVTSIGDGAFSECGLKSISIPSSVTSIGAYAFFKCVNLNSVTIPPSSGMTSIGYRAFYECTGLGSVTLPSGVTSIGGEAFRYCTGLASATILSRTSSFSNDVFLDVPGLVIYGFSGSTANAYATAMGIHFTPMYTVTFDSHGGTTLSSAVAAYNTAVPAPPNPTRTGCTFSGWFTVASGGSRVTFPYIVTGDVKLHAQWKVNAPSALKAVSASYNSIKLTWTSAPGVTGYKLIRSTSSTFTNPVTKTFAAGASSSFTDTGLATGTLYYYKLCAYVGAAANTSVYMNTASAKAVPATPAARAARASSTSIKVSWGGVTGSSGYEVYCATNTAGTYALKKAVASSTLSVTFTGLTTGRYYYYKVRAYRLVGGARVYGNFSAVVYAKP